MSEYQTVARVGSIAEGRGQTFPVGGRLVAVFLWQGNYYAIDDLCPHMGASLGAGEICQGAVACPWHAWRFSVTDGTWLDNPKLRVDRFECRVVGEEIQVRLPDARPAPNVDPTT